jgi:hypothetical protein
MMLAAIASQAPLRCPAGLTTSRPVDARGDVLCTNLAQCRYYYVHHDGTRYAIFNCERTYGKKAHHFPR